MRARAVAGSIVAHALLALALVSVRVAPAVDAPHGPIAVEVVVAAREPGGPSPSSHDPSEHRRAATNNPAPRYPSVHDPLSAREDLAWTVDRPGDGRGGDGVCGSSACAGRGRGAGIGFGEGGAIAEPPRVPVLPAPPPASKARPPRLIYPARERDIEAARLFVARLLIDRDGFVVGARLVRGFGGPRDDQAASAVWRFRYAPALDDNGAPIDATIDQQFMVE